LITTRTNNGGNNNEEEFGCMFDVIVTDPPYGIRAGAKKSGKKGGVAYTIEKERRFDHIPSTQTYAVEEVMLDLLHTAAKLLVM
jgi:tRNA (guanine10-N2)-methyltransferase